MALSQHQLDKAKKAIEFLSSLPTGSGEGSGTSGASRSIPTQSTSVRGSVNLSESRSSDAIKTEKGEYWYLSIIYALSFDVINFILLLQKFILHKLDSKFPAVQYASYAYYISSSTYSTYMYLSDTTKCG